MSKEKTSDSESLISSSDVNRRSFLKGLAVAGSAAAVGVSGCMNGEDGNGNGNGNQTVTKYACPYCDKEFDSEEELREHCEAEHMGPPEEEPKAGMMLYIDYENCTGCKICELACAKHWQDKISPDADTINLGYSRIQTGRYQFIDTVTNCRYCQLYEWAEGTSNFPCAEVCPVNAIKTVPEGEGEEGYSGLGYKKVDRDLCMGLDDCGRCLEICEEQFGSGMIFDPDEELAQVCTRCGGDPVCEEACTNDAIQFEAPMNNGRYFAHPPEQQAELLYRKIYDKRRDI